MVSGCFFAGGIFFGGKGTGGGTVCAPQATGSPAAAADLQAPMEALSSPLRGGWSAANPPERTSRERRGGVQRGMPVPIARLASPSGALCFFLTPEKEEATCSAPHKAKKREPAPTAGSHFYKKYRKAPHFRGGKCRFPSLNPRPLTRVTWLSIINACGSMRRISCSVRCRSRGVTTQITTSVSYRR